MLGIYFHFPYCIKKCNYCGFFSKIPISKDYSNLEEFFLKKVDEIDVKDKVTSIYFGGGTPSLMPVSMVSKILDKFDLNGVEVTLEVNPETVDKVKLQGFKDAGVNRLSIGVQSLNDDDLKFLGRIHNVNKAVEVIDAAKNIFNKVTIDLIYGRPNQSLISWEKELKKALEFDLKHFSLYQLSIDNDWDIVLPDDDMLASFYNITNSIMKDSGINRYEVSNYAKDQENQSRHNLTYWLGHDYIGIGPKAHSRFNNFEIENDENGEVLIKNKLSKKERDTEIFLTSLRTIYGVSNDYLYLTTPTKIKEMVQNGFILRDKNGIKVRDEGFLILDSVLNFLLV